MQRWEVGEREGGRNGEGKEKKERDRGGGRYTGRNEITEEARVWAS